MVSKTLRPQQRGQLVTALLTSDLLEQYVQTGFTARLEGQLDAISAGELEQLPFLSQWWGQFHTAVAAVEQTDTMKLREEVADKCAWTLFPSQGAVRPPLTLTGTPSTPTSTDHGTDENAATVDSTLRSERICPSCGVGKMSLKFSRFGPFVGCSEYPVCGWTMRPREPWVDPDAQPAIDKLALGVLREGALPELATDYTGLEVSVRDGPVGWYVQLGGNVSHEQAQLTPPPDVKALKIAQLREELERRDMPTNGRKAELAERLLQAKDLRHLVPHKRVSLPEGTKPIEVTMAMAERLLSLPKALGLHPLHKQPMTLHQGRFGPYVAMPLSDETAAGGSETDAKSTASPSVLCSLPKRVSIWDVDAPQAAELLDMKMLRDAKKRNGAKKAASTARAGAAKGAKPKAKPKTSSTRGSAKATKKPRRKEAQAA